MNHAEDCTSKEKRLSLKDILDELQDLCEVSGILNTVRYKLEASGYYTTAKSVYDQTLRIDKISKNILTIVKDNLREV